MTIDISNNDPRIEYVVPQGVTYYDFPVTFDFFADEDIDVYVGSSKATFGTQYNVTGGGGSTGNVNFPSGIWNQYVDVNVVIVRRTEIERTTDFPFGTDINRTALNEQFDKLFAIVADVNDKSNRGLKIPEYEVNVDLVIPEKLERAGRVLAFDSGTGDIVAGPRLDYTTSLSEITFAIEVLGNIQAGSSAITTVANVASQVEAVGDNIGHVVNALSNANAAQISANNAAASETAAAQSEANALSFRDSAAFYSGQSAGYASASSSSATAAQQSATDSSNSAALAEQARNAADNFANDAEASKISANAAVTLAQGYADDANLYRAEASTSAGVAEVAEVNATNAKIAAELAETNAEAFATNAAASDSSAFNSAAAAETSATNSANSATASAASATAAASSATAAATSASNAQTAADTALSALDSFDDRYLGQKASDPTTDNDGDPLVAGALYYNTTDEIMKVYEGAQWVAAYASLSGAMFGSNNLSDVTDIAASRTNLGLGTAATSNTGDFAAASHSHAISDVTNLQTTLDAKADLTGASFGYVSSTSDITSNFGITAYTNHNQASVTFGSDGISGTKSVIYNGAENFYRISWDYDGDLVFNAAQGDDIIFKHGDAGAVLGRFDGGDGNFYIGSNVALHTGSTIDADTLGGAAPSAFVQEYQNVILGNVLANNLGTSATQEYFYGGTYYPGAYQLTEYLISAFSGAIDLAGIDTGGSMLIVVNDYQGRAPTLSWIGATFINNGGSGPTVAAGGRAGVVAWRTSYNQVYAAVVGVV